MTTGNEGDFEGWLAEVFHANLGIHRYWFRMELIPGVVFQGLSDTAEGRQYVQIGISGGPFPQAEAFCDGQDGYGRNLQTDIWWRLTPQPQMNYVLGAAGLLQAADITSRREEGPFWVVEAEIDCWSCQPDLEEFLGSLEGGPEGAEFEAWLQDLEGREVQISVRVRIERETLWIAGLDLSVQAEDWSSQLLLELHPDDTPLPPRPEVLHVRDPHVEMPMPLLPFQIPSIGGWQLISHRKLMQRSIDLVKKDDETISRYGEIYDPAWSDPKVGHYDSGPGDHLKHHPMVIGASEEDNEDGMPAFYKTWFATDDKFLSDNTYYFDLIPNGWQRDYHHYGGKDMGVKDEWYYVFRPGNNPGPTVGDYYYSARDWGHGGLARNGDKNRLTFVEAIKQYYRYSVEGKRNAYLMLGHVAHLLQDSGQPDHATLTPHVSSSEDGAFVEEIYCPLHAAAIATMKCKIWLLASAAAFAAGNWATAAVAFGTWLTCTATETGIHSAACLLAVDASHVGYEELIGTYWRTTAQELTNLLTTAAIVSCQNYDEYFGKLADFAAAQPKKYGLQSPLGCSSLGLLPPFGKIPSLLPTIDPASDQAKAPYFKLTDALVAEIVGYTAGFVEYFQEIVNYPPILERVAIVQWEPHDTPRRFAFFKNDAEHCLRYDAEWKIAAKGKSRTLTQHATQPALQNIFPAISPDRSVYLFLRFGPTIGLTRDVAKGTVAAQVTGRVMNEDTLTLRLTANHLDPRTGQPIDHTVSLVRADDDDGPYYWGEYTPHNCCSDAYLLTLTVDGEDTLAHLAGRSGSKLDPDPAKTAQVNADSGHPFSWQAGSYIPGADTNHQIWVDAYKGAKLVVTPARLEIDVSAADPSADALLAVKQQARKCNWEIREALTNCPVTWELVPKVSKDIEIVRGGIVIPGQYTEIPAVFGLQVDLTASPTGTARVAVRVTKAGRDTAGTYTIKVNYTINTGLLPSTSQIVEIPVEVK